MFKYQEQIIELPSCPPPVCKPIHIEAFRFVFEDIDHKNNFLPALLINPRRRISGDSAKCSGYALSFFTSLEKAKIQFLKLKKRNKAIGKRLGTHIAKGFIEKTDGVVSSISKSGHFDLHEFEKVDLQKRFSITCSVEG